MGKHSHDGRVHSLDGQMAAIIGIWLSAMRYAHEHLEDFHKFNGEYIPQMTMTVDEIHDDLDHAIIQTQHLGSRALDRMAQMTDIDLAALLGDHE